MNEASLVQRSVEWFEARCGSLGASRIGKALEKLKRGERAKASLDIMHELAAERIIRAPTQWVNPLKWGVDHEAEARAAYVFLTNLPVTEVGMVLHPTIEHAHCSPDALVGDDGVHLATMLSETVPEEHLPQIHWSLACTGRAWWHFMSFDPRFPPERQIFLKRVERDEKIIAGMEAEARAFLAELDEKVARLSGAA